MSSDNRNISVNDYEMNIDLYSILRDIWKYALVILLLAASMSMVSYVYVGRSYHKQYESTSTFIVSSKGSNNSVYSDLSATSEMASRFSEILNSSILQKKVAKEMNMDQSMIVCLSGRGDKDVHTIADYLAGKGYLN